ncbi:hypothetical protein ACFQ1L_31090 [Phytohabitans flavus]|uniref:hypothetical protein n=1 Tax=Phytohabitans flavus TaxID=1076124 RepID=UPI003645EBC8
MTKSHVVAAWAALYGTLALVWTATGRGFPFGSNDPAGGASLLRWLPADAGRHSSPWCCSGPRLRP